jgi:methylamine dehydrogenase accessory protein MauD
MPIGWAIAIVVLWVAVLALVVVVLGVLRQVTPILERAAAYQGALSPASEGPQVGEQVPHFSARDTDGEFVGNEELRGRPVLLLFLSAGCAPCEQLATGMRRADLDALAKQLIIVTTRDVPRILGIPAGLRVVIESANEITDPLSVMGLPFAVAVDADGIVRAAEVPETVGHLEKLSAVVS